MATARKSGNERARAVVSISEAKLGLVELHLECGHVQRRRFTFEKPARVICSACRTQGPPSPSVTVDPKSEG